MRDLMPWDRCEREFIRKVSVDEEQIGSMIETALGRKRFIEQTKTVDQSNVSFVVEGHYEVIKELLVAFLLKNGLKSSNHQCLFSYFYKMFPNHELETDLLLQMSYLRNRLDYYGEKIDVSFYEKNKEDIAKLIDLLLKLLKI